MNIIVTIIYIWLTLVFMWYGKHAKAGYGEKPMLLYGEVMTLIFEILGFVWIIFSIVLLLKNWILPVSIFFGFYLLNIVLSRVVKSISLEEIALIPIYYLKRGLEKWAEKKYKK